MQSSVSQSNGAQGIQDKSKVQPKMESIIPLPHNINEDYKGDQDRNPSAHTHTTQISATIMKTTSLKTWLWERKENLPAKFNHKLALIKDCYWMVKNLSWSSHTKNGHRTLTKKNKCKSSLEKNSLQSWPQNNSHKKFQEIWTHGQKWENPRGSKAHKF